MTTWKAFLANGVIIRLLPFILLFGLAQNVFAAKADTTVDKTKAPVIYEIIVDFETAELQITGFNFLKDTEDPVAYFGNNPTPLTILSVTDTELVTSFPSEVPDGDYMLLIENSSKEQIGHDLTIDRELSETEVVAYVDGNGYVSGPHYTDVEAIAAVGPHLTITEVEAILAASISSVETTVAELQAQVASQQGIITALEAELANTTTNVSLLQTDFGTHMGNLTAHHVRYADAEAISAVGPHFSGNHADLINVTSDQHHADMADSPVFDLEPFVSVSHGSLNALAGPHILFDGVNIHIRSGSGSTNDDVTDPETENYTGLGNLIIGYNEYCCGSRTGSHNFVIGTAHQYTSYGGFIAGHRNNIYAESGSVTGGFENTVEGRYSSVAGGQFNTAEGWATSVSGGKFNTSSNQFTNVSGGEGNQAMGTFSSISGGHLNIVTGFWSTVSGGQENWASRNASSISGGRWNTASKDYSSVSGGSWNTASGYYSSVNGGENNTASGSRSTINGGHDNTIYSAVWATIGGGNGRAALSDYDWVAGSLTEDY